MCSNLLSNASGTDHFKKVHNIGAIEMKSWSVVNLGPDFKYHHANFMLHNNTLMPMSGCDVNYGQWHRVKLLRKTLLVFGQVRKLKGKVIEFKTACFNKFNFAWSTAPLTISKAESLCPIPRGHALLNGYHLKRLFQEEF